MRWKFMGLSLAGWICVALLVGCNRASNVPQNQTQNAQTTEADLAGKGSVNARPSALLAREVPPGMGGDFSFVCPADGEATITITGDTEMSVFLMSHEWAEAAQKISAIPGLNDALKRGDDQTVSRLINESVGASSPAYNAYFFDGDVNVRFDLPRGRSQRKFRLLRGRYLLTVSNKGDKAAKIETAFLPAQ